MKKLRPSKEPFRLSVGERGEMAAWDFLLKRGFTLLDKNYRCPLGEIDVVAQKGREVVFIEIKTRTSERHGTPEESVDRLKQKKLVRLAQWYRKAKSLEGLPASFAVVAVDWKAGVAPAIRLIDDAFGAEPEENFNS